MIRLTSPAEPSPRKSATARASGLSGYTPFLSAVKQRIRAAQVKATLAANAELIQLYWDIGRAIAALQEKEGWGARVIPRLAMDIANDMPEVKGFSERNIKRMLAFAREYPTLRPIVPQAVAQLPASGSGPQSAAPSATSEGLTEVQQLAACLPWGHNVILIEKVKNLRMRLWYAQQTIAHGWSRVAQGTALQSPFRGGNGKRTLPPHCTDDGAETDEEMSSS